MKATNGCISSNHACTNSNQHVCQAGGVTIEWSADRQLLNAVAWGQWQRITALVKKGADPNAKAFRGDLLHFAIGVGRARSRTVRALLEAGADANGRDPDGWTPLMSAVALPSGDPRTVQALLDAGADPRAEGVHHEYCAWPDQLAITGLELNAMDRWLNGDSVRIEKKIMAVLQVPRLHEKSVLRAPWRDDQRAKVPRPHFDDSSEASPLARAIRSGLDVEVIVALLARGVDANDVDVIMAIEDAALCVPEEDPWLEAICSQASIREVLLSRRAADQAAFDLQLALEENDATAVVECIETMLAAGDDANIDMGEGTFLAQAIRHRCDISIVAHLMDTGGADVTNGSEDALEELARSESGPWKRGVLMLRPFREVVT